MNDRMIRLTFPDKYIFFHYDAMAEYVAEIYAKAVRRSDKSLSELTDKLYEMFNEYPFELFDYMKNSMDWKDISHLIEYEEERTHNVNYHEAYRDADLEVLP